MRRPFLQLLALLLFLLAAGLSLPVRPTAADGPDAKGSKAVCNADQIRADKEAALADLRAGRYCTVCARTPTEFRRSRQNYEGHFKNADAKKAKGAAPERIMQAKARHFDHLLANQCGISNDCEALYAYRDNELFNEWNKTVAKVSIYTEARNDMRRQREKLLDDNRWATSKWSLLQAYVAKNLETTADLINNLLELNPAGAAAGRVIRGGKNTARRVFEALESGKKIQKITNGELGDVLFDELMSTDALPYANLRKGAKTIKDLGKSVKEMTEFKQNQEELKATIRENLDMIDAAMSQQEERLKNSRQAMQALDEIRKGIDSYCLEQHKKLNNPELAPPRPRP